MINLAVLEEDLKRIFKKYDCEIKYVNVIDGKIHKDQKIIKIRKPIHVPDFYYMREIIKILKLDIEDIIL